MSKPYTIVMAYYENPGMLKIHYDYIRALPAELRDFIQLIVVDDGSPDHPAKPPEEPIGIPMQLYRIGVDIRWNQDAARNIGMRHCETEWAILTDMDLLVPEETHRGLQGKPLDEEVIWTFRRVLAPNMTPYKSHPNSWFMTRRRFEAVEGYDERFAGIYGSDGDFRNRMRERGWTMQEMKCHLVSYQRSVVPDASTTRYLRKQPEDEVGKRRVRSERLKAAGKDGKTGWHPIRYRFPYELVWRTP